MQPDRSYEREPSAGNAPQEDRDPVDALSILVYAELRRVAELFLRHERKNHTLEPTALVHEAYLRLAHDPAFASLERDRFLALAARVMRQVLVDSARSREASKRGGGIQPITLEGRDAATFEGGVDLLALDEALETLATLDERQHRIVEMRFFGGMTVEEVARVLSVSKRTVEAEWTLARAWLSRELA